MLGLLVVQLLLGLGAYTTKYSSAATLFSPAARDTITVGHVLVGGLMLATSIIAALYLFQAGVPSLPNRAGLARSTRARKVMAQ
jgi:heme A synthase